MNIMTVSGMTGGGCVQKVEAAVKTLSPEATVTLDPPQLSVPGAISVLQINEALAALGRYRVAEPAEKLRVPGKYKAWFVAYWPLYLIMGLIALSSIAGESWMMAFMAGFYIVFGAFKLLDVRAFAIAYAQYDIVAKVFKPWGYAYPFIEVALGFAFLFWFAMGPATWAALILSLIGTVGALQAVKSKQATKCACLGTVFLLPMSKITVVENFGMAAMAGWMLLFGM